VKLVYTDRQGVTYELKDAEAGDLPRFIRAVRADTGAVVIVHEDGVKQVATPPEPKKEN
jgi:hypothetical protein